MDTAMFKVLAIEDFNKNVDLNSLENCKELEKFMGGDNWWTNF